MSDQRRALRIVDAEAFERLCSDASIRRKTQSELRRDATLGVELGDELSALQEALGSSSAVNGFDEEGSMGIRLGAGAWLLPHPIVEVVSSALAERLDIARREHPHLRESLDALVALYRRAAEERRDVLVLGAPDPFKVTKPIAAQYTRALVAEENRRSLRQETWQARVIPHALDDLRSASVEARREGYADLTGALVDAAGRVHPSASTYTRGLWASVLSRGDGRIAALATLLAFAKALGQGGDGAPAVQRALSDGFAEIEDFLDELLSELPSAAGAALIVCALLSNGRTSLVELAPDEWMASVRSISEGTGDAYRSALAALEEAVTASI